MIGNQVSHFKILLKIGEGGMGIIYLAEDINLGRKVALKFLSPPMLDSREAKERFLQEARLASKLEHTNICTVYEIGETASGQLFIAMAFYQGKTVKEICREREPGLREILEIISQVCAGLRHAHNAGITHRDIKPANIFLTTSGVVKILDFGLARLENGHHLTRTGSSIGTAAYMSPEQVEGRKGDQRMDIWATGVLLYELLNREPPFRGRDAAAILYAIVHTSPPGLEIKNPALPLPLIQIVERCLSKKAENRFPDMHALEESLDKVKALLKTNPPTRRQSFRHRLSLAFSRWKRKRLLPVLGVLLLGLAIGTGGFLLRSSTFSGHELPAVKHIAILPFKVSTNNPAVKDMGPGLSVYLIDKFLLLEKFLPDFWILAEETIFNRNDFSPRLLNEDFSVNLVIDAELTRSDGGMEIALKIIDAVTGKPVRALRNDKPTNDLTFWRDTLPGDLLNLLDIKVNNEMEETLRLGNTALPGAFTYYIQGCGRMLKMYNRAKLAYDPGFHREAETDMDKAAECFEKSLRQDTGFLWGYLKLAEVQIMRTSLAYLRLQHSNEPIRVSNYFELAAAYTRHTGEAGNRIMQAAQANTTARKLAGSFSLPYRMWGDILVLQQNTAAAAEAYYKALEFNRDDYTTFARLASLYDTTGQLDKAEQAMLRMITTRPDFSPGYEQLGYFYIRTGRYPEAIKQYTRVTELTPRNAGAYLQLGSLQALLMNLDEAITMFEKSAALEPSDYVTSNLATLYYYNRQYTEATLLYRQALENKNNPRLPLLLNLAESLWLSEGGKQEARVIFTQLVSELSAITGDGIPQPFEGISLALCHAYLGETEAALTILSPRDFTSEHNPDLILTALVAYELCGKRKEALQTVKSYLSHYGPMLYLEKHPLLHELRQDNAYHLILEKKFQ